MSSDLNVRKTTEDDVRQEALQFSEKSLRGSVTLWFLKRLVSRVETKTELI